MYVNKLKIVVWAIKIEYMFDIVDTFFDMW